MDIKESAHILAAIIIVAIVLSFKEIFQGEWLAAVGALLSSALLILVVVCAKKVAAFSLDASAKNRIWGISRWGFAAHRYFKREVPAGLIAPLFFTLISLGALKIMPVLTYEASALKARAARRFGYYSYTIMSEWHNALIGTAGIGAVLLLSFASYFAPWNLGMLSKAAAYYALVNLIPISNLDGTQIFFGSRVLWTVLLAISVILSTYALLLV